MNVFGGGASLSTAGMLFALGGAFAYALYVLLAEHVVGGRDPVSLLAWGFLFASVFWAVLVPWWSFPGHALTARHLARRAPRTPYHLPVWLLATWMVVLGTIAPFFLLVSALRHLSATTRRDRRDARAGRRRARRLGVARRALGGVQLAGAAVVLAAIVLAQTAR